MTVNKTNARHAKPRPKNVTTPARAAGGRRTAAIAPVVIRPISPNDGKAFLSLMAALADYEKLPRPSPAARRRLLRDCTGPKRKFETLLAFSGGRPVGYAVFFETYSTFLAKPTLYLEDLFVLPESRGLGIGLRLFRACLAEAKRRGCGRMEWTVLDWNTGAARFYEKLGASRMPEWELFRLLRKDFDRALGVGRPGIGRPGIGRPGTGRPGTGRSAGHRARR
jgi:GNAT superfamily N-acetyltransferase